MVERKKKKKEIFTGVAMARDKSDQHALKTPTCVDICMTRNGGNIFES